MLENNNKMGCAEELREFKSGTVIGYLLVIPRSTVSGIIVKVEVFMNSNNSAKKWNTT